MVGKFKIIVVVFILFCSCKKQNDINDIGKDLIKQNINVLLDSVEGFDMSTLPPSPKFKNVKTKKITLGLLDSIKINDSYSLRKDNFKSFKYLKFNLQKSDLSNFKSSYTLNLQKKDNLSTDVLSIRFTNFKINENKASIDVTKVIGISMICDRFYFEKENDIWVFKKKVMLMMG